MAKDVRFGISAMVACAALVACATRAVQATPVSIVIPGMPAGTTTANVQSLVDEKWEGIVRQRTDFSCGAAALATLLTDAYGLRMSERGVMQAMLDVSDPEIVRHHGFSLLEIKAFLASIGMRGVGYEISPATLLRIKVPTIAVIDVDGYAHFVVVKSAVSQYVFIADPSRGNLTMSIPDFVRAWNGIAFVVEAPEYDRDNSLRDVRYPASAGRLISGTAPSLDPVSDNLLMYVGSFASRKLP